MPSKSVEKLTPEVVDLVNRLSRSERTELARHEKTIDKALPAFAEIGEALNAIRESKLYREAYPTFDAYLADRWSFTRQRASQLIDAAETMRQLPASVAPKVKTERAARAMKPVADKPAKAKKVAKAAGPDPSAADLERAVTGVVGGGDATVPAPVREPPPAHQTGDPARDWITATDALHLPPISEPMLRKMRATASGLVQAIDVALGESVKARHAASAAKKRPVKRDTSVTPNFKTGSK